MTNWENIHKDFGYSWLNLQKNWEEQNFTYQQTKSWIEVGLKPDEYKFASYLKQNNYQPSTVNLEKASKEYNQNWLNINYPNKPEAKEITINSSEQLHGFLTISDYPNLESIDIEKQKNLNQLYLSNCPNLRGLSAKFSKLINIDLTELPNLEELNLSGNSLTNLDLTNNKKLRELDISWNDLTNLNINHLKKLEWLNIDDNNLIELNIKNLINLKWFFFSNNNFAEQDLSWLSHLVNLKKLELVNWNQEKINQGIYNHFYGSLEPLKNMNKLEELNISNTDIDSGLEHLPDSLKYFKCSADKRPEAKVKVLEKELKEFGEDFPNNLNLLKKNKQVEEKRILNISLEKLYTTRRDLEKFLDRWKNGLSDLQWVERFEYAIKTVRWANWGVLVTSGVQLIRGDSSMSDWTTLISPFIEVVISNLEAGYERNKSDKIAFDEGSERIWDNCDELTKMLEPIDTSLIRDESTSRVFEDLKKNIYDFWKRYDYDDNNKINDEEWKRAKEEFPQNLRKNWKNWKKELEEIKETAERLRKLIIVYLSDKDLKDEQNENQREIVIDLDKYFKEKQQTPASSKTNLLPKKENANEVIEMQNLEQEAKIIQFPYGTPGSSKK
ncbi:leucine-rich repeat domain-containing protein [endosymbiont GvMRE of Glomus versiforme]|uniref:leucine-rich repeat domain-containing protein n=1 Tax=endosymbiont GvMRE of Glomus versiforme TaxID=2039283 RepID=UPI000EDCAB30|nr:leucine-rich repeat domain-containing protein [endosymbiont GvMRE of Glomus versiforme]RHZ37161.1 Cdc15p [endosymbiont GvMRE of Glomus versiforme]